MKKMLMTGAQLLGFVCVVLALSFGCAMVVGGWWRWLSEGFKLGSRMIGALMGI